MATVTYFVDGQVEHKDLGGRVVFAENKLDFSARNVAALDVVQAVKLPANSLATSVHVRTITPEGGAALGDVGDGSDADGWHGSTNLNAASGTLSFTTSTDAYDGGKFYASADTIDIVPNAVLDTAVIAVGVTYTVPEKFTV